MYTDAVASYREPNNLSPAIGHDLEAAAPASLQDDGSAIGLSLLSQLQAASDPERLGCRSARMPSSFVDSSTNQLSFLASALVKRTSPIWAEPHLPLDATLAHCEIISRPCSVQGGRPRRKVLGPETLSEAKR